MVLGWSVFMPLGIIAARFSGDFPKIGFPVHRALQSLGALMGIIAFIIIVVHTEDQGKGAMLGPIYMRTDLDSAETSISPKSGALISELKSVVTALRSHRFFLKQFCTRTVVFCIKFGIAYS